ncbi:MAG: DUF1549 and DUF1553 domain-containing protein, partial [Acidobacteriota bacterium]|nr:DUF1549 and DUF1553 domain-containing protein [Acidobacteriota bacterium]
TRQAAELAVDHSDCTLFGAKRETFMKSALRVSGVPEESQLSRTTRAVTKSLHIEGASSISDSSASSGGSFSTAPAANSIDAFILADLKSNNVTPADKTDDYTFIRLVTLDLTGRIPTPERIRSFANDYTPGKRANLIDELLAKPEWVDKWTMYYGDLLQNNATNVAGTQRRPEGRNAFYKYIHDSLTANKPYDKMAGEIIAAQGTNNFDQTNGQVNWIIGGVVSGGPQQDIFDQQTVNVAEQFLGMTHVNCLLCHNGRGHLDSINLWASQTTRYQAWQLSAFMARTWPKRVKITDPNQPQNNNLYYWTVDKYTTDYQLGSTTGNRPARIPLGTGSTAVKVIAPNYFLTGGTPSQGEDYRTALAKFITADPQFARAAVNYVWAQFFGRGIVDPPDQFDPARLDPANPPPAPWTLQPSNPALLNALTQHFIASGFDLQALQREIVNSETYQLSSEYNGTWDAANEKYFARKFVRRLWAEEIHDAVVQATGVIPSYSINGFSKDSTTYGVTSPGFGNVSYAMQLPDVAGMPGGTVTAFLDTFLRGDRDVNPRRPDGSILQALDLMNDAFVESRIKSTTTGGLLAKSLTLPNAQLLDTLYMSALSRRPTDAEINAGLQKLMSGNRASAAEDIFWALFNKVDFIFNY